MIVIPKPNHGAKISLQYLESTTNWIFQRYGLPSGSMNFNNVQLFNDANVEEIGSQMPQNVEGSRNMTMQREAKITTKKEDDLGNKKRDRASISKLLKKRK